MLVLYEVQPNDTISSIAQQFNISEEIIIRENQLDPESRLSVGQIIIIAYPTQIYTVKEGDTLYGIAQENNVSVMDVLRNNPDLSNQNILEVGEELVIGYGNKEKQIGVNGMTYTFIDEETLVKTLPFLTYITIMGSQVESSGIINDINDKQIIQLAYQYGVVPLLLISTLSETGQGNPNLNHLIFSDEKLQSILIENIISKLRYKGYQGAVFGFENVEQIDRERYTQFIVRASARLHEEGLLSGAVLIPDTFGYSQEYPLDQDYFARIGQSVDQVILLSYQWATSYIPQFYQTTYLYLRDYVRYAISQIESEKIYLGITRIAYDWELPYVEGESFVASLTIPGAIALANQYESVINYDETTQIPYFEYTVAGVKHIVWFKDARQIVAILELVVEYNLGGICAWNIMYYYNLWLIVNTKLDIDKVLPVA